MEKVRGVVGELEVEAGVGEVKKRERKRKVVRVDAMKMEVRAFFVIVVFFFLFVTLFFLMKLQQDF